MNKLMEGKMISAVNGVGDTTAAVAKELKATSTGVYGSGANEEME